MTSKTSAVLKSNKANGRGSLIGYFPAGYPTLDDSVEAAIAMCENGVDVLELGVPYSDPVMDGVVIQEATLQALENGFKLKQVFDAVRRITAEVGTPVLVMTYWNPVLQYGVENFARELVEAGGAGLITPDLIPDEAGQWLEVSDKYDLDRVFLGTPSSSTARMKTAADLSRGFVYAVSTMGITGARNEVDANARKVVAKVREVSSEANTAVGIGISTAAQVEEVNEYADGAIVGSAFVRAYADGGVAALKSKTIELSARLKK
ncbi:MAG: tryptophan synthase subunit alpha [Rhodoluna sp.]